MMLLRTTLLTSALVLGLVACGEADQTAKSAYKRSDTPAWQGAANPYGVADWKPSDQAAWEQQLRRRAAGQNEYSRVN
ncbi:hypothetical protein [Caldimonas caldifontis]|nr:hypothetical protein [Caldimonas caldifontis]